MENFNNGGYDHEEAEDRRDYGERQSYNEEGQRRPYGDSSERPHRNYGEHHYNGNSHGGHFHNYGDRPRNNYGGGYQRRSYNQNGDDGYNRQHGNYGQQRRSYNNQNSEEGYSNHHYGDEGYNRPRSGGYQQRRPYNQDSEEGYNRPRNGAYQHRSYNNQNGGEGYNRPRSGAYQQRRPYNQDSEEGYNRPRRNNYGGGYSNRRYTPNFSSMEERPQRGTKLRPRKTKPQMRPAESGIDKMIKRNPQLNDIMYSDNDLVNIPVKEVVRLNKFIANSGICSRREADNFITAGVVTVNGEVVTELGSKVNINTDDVRFNGERLRGESKVYIVMNKPKGFVTTASDPHAEKTVMSLLNGCPARVFPVGRLDKNTTGVLMFTNDGEIAEKLTHPSYDKKKIYQVSLSNPLTQEDYDKILAGVTLTDGEIAADALEYVDENDHRKIGIEIHSGKNRIVRRIFESLGYDVKGLDRVYFAGLTKKGIKRGGWRYLTEGEINVLRMGAYK